MHCNAIKQWNDSAIVALKFDRAESSTITEDGSWFVFFLNRITVCFEIVNFFPQF